jgi:hypothetical protein
MPDGPGPRPGRATAASAAAAATGPLPGSATPMAVTGRAGLPGPGGLSLSPSHRGTPATPAAPPRRHRPTSDDQLEVHLAAAPRAGLRPTYRARRRVHGRPRTSPAATGAAPRRTRPGRRAAQAPSPRRPALARSLCAGAAGHGPILTAGRPARLTGTWPAGQSGWHRRRRRGRDRDRRVTAGAGPGGLRPALPRFGARSSESESLELTCGSWHVPSCPWPWAGQLALSD